MSTRPPHPGAGSACTVRLVHDDSIETSPPVTAGRACCCPALPLARVTIPRSATRPHSTDLLLCGHHYRVSRQALVAAGATVTVLPGLSGNPPQGLLPDLPAPREPVT